MHLLTYAEFPSVQGQNVSEGHQSTSALLELIRGEIKRLRRRSILKSELYSYLLDLVEEDANIANEDVCILLCLITRLTFLAEIGRAHV